MTIFSTNSVFQPAIKNIKYQAGDLKVISGASTLADLSLCSVKIPFKQYTRLQVQIPAGQTDYVLSFAMLGLKITFLAIKASYCSVNTTKNYLKWKFQPSSDAKWSMTSILTLTGTAENPITPILIDNPNTECAVTLDILVSALDTDYLNDTAAFVYLKDLKFDLVHTYNETTSGILALFNAANELVTTVNLVDIINVQRIAGKNRIVIDESSESNIVLDFIDNYNTLQALSAINWLLLDPATRLLPQAADILAPVITYTGAVVLSSIPITLASYPLGFTKQDFITAAIVSITDARDGVSIPTINNIVFKDNVNTVINTINAVGTYTGTISVSDIAGNITTAIITIVVT